MCVHSHARKHASTSTLAQTPAASPCGGILHEWRSSRGFILCSPVHLATVDVMSCTTQTSWRGPSKLQRQ
jgi:hypothetical protein